MKDDPLDKLNSARYGGELHRQQVSAQYQAQTPSHPRREAPLARESLIDLKIKQAEAEGQFKNLPGQGEPFDLNQYAGTPEHLRAAYHLLKSGGFLPEEVRLKREMEDIKQRLRHCSDDHEKAALQREFCEASQKFHFCMEYNHSLKRGLY